MKKTDKDGSDILHAIARDQGLGGAAFVVGGSYELPSAEPYRIIEGKPVYHDHYNYSHLPERSWRPSRMFSWGWFYHPSLIIGMPSVGGDCDLLVDTRVKGWYQMWLRTKMDASGFGPMPVDKRIMAWTPHYPGDDAESAGYRLFRALVFAMDDVKEDEIYTRYYRESNWRRDWWVSLANCLAVFAAVRPTRYKDEADFQAMLKSAPESLHEHIRHNRVE